MRGDRKKQEERNEKGEDAVASDQGVIDIRNYKPKRIPQLMWRECIKKIWGVDPLTCPKCTGEMKIISFIYQRKVIEKILTHLNIFKEMKNQRAPPRVEPEYTEPVIVLFDVAGRNTMRRFSESYTPQGGTELSPAWGVRILKSQKTVNG